MAECMWARLSAKEGMYFRVSMNHEINEITRSSKILILSQQGYTNVGKHYMNVRTNRKILAHISVCVFQIPYCAGAGSQYNLNMHSKRKKAVAQCDVGVSLDHDKNDVGKKGVNKLEGA